MSDNLLIHIQKFPLGLFLHMLYICKSKREPTTICFNKNITICYLLSKTINSWISTFNHLLLPCRHFTLFTFNSDGVIQCQIENFNAAVSYMINRSCTSDNVRIIDPLQLQSLCVNLKFCLQCVCEYGKFYVAKFDDICSV